MRIPIFILVSLFFLEITSSLHGQSLDGNEVNFFETKIRPVLAEHCYQCHSEEARKNRKLKGDLLLDTRAGLIQGGATGPAVVVGKPAESLIIKAIRHEGDLRMPRGNKLPETVIADFERWIKLGLIDPRDGKKPANAKELNWREARQFWAFQKPVPRPLPKVKGTAWPKRDIDYFVLAELEKINFVPVGLATKRELLRRATFDLTGLPPTPEEIDEFLKNDSPDAFAQVLDRLLASPHYGERWARYWLDVSRYAEDKALAFANTRPHAYRYRDWVVQALNDDMPYDRFVRLQLAGDLLPDGKEGSYVKLAGLGFQGLGAEYHRGSVTAQVIADELDDRIDTLSRGLLGLTVACARCHDHKYDPIPTRDYYSLAAAYNGSTLDEKPLADGTTVQRFKSWEKKAKDSETQLNQWLKEQTREPIKFAVTETGRYLQAAWQVRLLQQNRAADKLADLARSQSLHPLFLERTIKFLDQAKFDNQDPAVKTWLAVAGKAEAAARRMGDMVALTDEFSKATEILGKEIRSAFMQMDGKSQPNLLKTLWLSPNAIFFVTEKEMPQFLAENAQKEYAKRNTELENIRKQSPPLLPMGHIISGGGTAMRVNVRGNVERAGGTAPPGFLQVLIPVDSANQLKEKFTRLDLAEAIASAKNPLTARVIVNRVWHYHFGRGIVGTPSNFGSLGDRPTHPELLDTLAVRFMENGWSLRWLHREIMLSSTYQLASTNVKQNAEKDPENHYLWRHSPRRLDFEAWRDAWLAVSGRLDRTIGGPSVDLNQADNVRRTIYAKISRLQPNPLLVLFDFPDANVSSDQRNVTTVPQQQLFVLNSEFTIAAAKAFAKRLEKMSTGENERILSAFRLAFGRDPSEAEKRASQEFLRETRAAQTQDRLNAWEQFSQAILASNEFLWVD